MNMATAVSIRPADVKNAQAFVQFITTPEATALWKAKGTNPY